MREVHLSSIYLSLSAWSLCDYLFIYLLIMDNHFFALILVLKRFDNLFLKANIFHIEDIFLQLESW